MAIQNPLYNKKRVLNNIRNSHKTQTKLIQKMTNKNCKTCAQSFEITPEDEDFYKKLGIPYPTNCPDCRKQRLISWRNERKYYQRKCDLCNKQVISIHSQDKPYPIYCNSCWWGDKWDPTEFAQEIDFTKPFFPQFIELQSKVPQLAIINDNGVQSENCEYCQDFAFGKDCYLVTGGWRIRDSYYSNNINHGQNLVDCSSVNIHCELVYESISCQRLYNCKFMQNSVNCHDCAFGFDLKGCGDCTCCIGLRQKEFHIFNKPYSKEDYFEKLKEFDTGSYENLEKTKKEFYKFIEKHPRKNLNQVRCQDCEGNDLFNCKNTLGFDTFNAEHCKFFEKGDHPLYCYDIYQSGNSQWCCESITPDDSYMTYYTAWCWKDKNVAYSDNCHSSENLFGCISLRHKRHCILNKQYSPEEYQVLRKRLVEHMTQTGEWGEFFPMSMSPFAYNETIAQDYFPLTKEKAETLGLKWKDEDKKEYLKQTHTIPDHITETPDSITKETLSCTECSKNYRIIPEELKFYRTQNLPIPHACPDCRNAKRIELKAPSKLFDRTCDNCKTPIQTIYSPDKPEKIYCEKCYTKEVC